jgi:DNA-binding transcriptional LysR family regulator
MKQVNIATVDLNLLKTFVAVWESRSLTLAADMLHLSQPAVSHALRRLRDVFDDQLFVRSGSGMVPTDVAVRLHGPIDMALGIIRSTLQQIAEFDEATSDRTFRLSMSDMAALHVLPKLAAHLSHCAPGMRLETRCLSVVDLDAAMRAGEIDVAVGYLPGLSDECYGDDLLEDRFVCMMANSHPYANQHLTVELLNRMRFVHAETNATGHGLAERMLYAAGVHRQIAVRVPHFTVAPEVAANTDLAMIVPLTIAHTTLTSRRFVVKELPFEMPPVPVKVYSHNRFASDLGILWMRRTMVRLFSDRNYTARLGQAANGHAARCAAAEQALS